MLNTLVVSSGGSCGGTMGAQQSSEARGPAGFEETEDGFEDARGSEVQGEEDASVACSEGDEESATATATTS